MSVEALSVLRVRNVLLVTVPPDPDDETINRLQEKVLASMESKEARGLIMDISTVESLDSFFARTILETAQMVALMGGRTIIAGMQSTVAITATQLGLNLGSLDAARDVDRALDLIEKGSAGRRPL